MARPLILIGVLLLVMVARPSFAITFEPYAGKLTGTVNYKYEGAEAVTFPADYTDKMKGTGYGMRVLMGARAFVGVDYFALSGGAVQVDARVSSEESKFELKSWYGLMGIGSPLGFRLFAGYGWKNDFSLTDSDGVRTKLSGKSWKAGVSVGLWLVNVSAEYVKWNYKKYADADSAGGIEEIYKKYDNDGVFLSVAIPITF